MKEIKTIYHKNIDDFDVEVNNELSNGWTLTWRSAQVYNGDVHLFAGLERDVETEKERTEQDHICETCKHFTKSCKEEPCYSCIEEDNKWEAAE